MSEEDKKLQKHLVDEMMKVYETNPDVMLYMQSLMENYEKFEQENKQLKEELENIKDFNNKLQASKDRLDKDDYNLAHILNELEEWLKEIKKIYEEDVFDIVSNTIYNQCEDVLDKIQELKEKYK